MVKNFWDHQSLEPDDYFTYHHSTEITRLLQRHLNNNDTVLDYGCGPGFLIKMLLDSGFRVAGLDYSQATRSRVRSSFPQEEGFIGVFSPDEMMDSNLLFNAVTVVEVIEHLYDEQLNVLLKNVQSRLKDNGIVLFTTPNEEDLAKSYMLCPVSNQVFHRWQHVREWSTGKLSDYLTEQGFEVIFCKAMDFSTSFMKKGKKNALHQTWSALKRRLKYKFNPGKKAPHLVAIARKAL